MSKKNKPNPNNELSIYKQSLKHLPKAEKIIRIEQELNNRSLSKLPPFTGISKVKPSDQELEQLKAEIEDNYEAYESESKRKELIPFMYDRDLNWFFNAKNIPAQSEMVLPTYEYFKDGSGKDFFEPIDFFNLLINQYDHLQQIITRPFDVLSDLQSIPLTDRERHILYGFILKWFGGYPVTNRDEQCKTVLKLIEKEFLNYPEHTPEKEFCASDQKFSRKLQNFAALMNAESGIKVEVDGVREIIAQHDISESHYIKKVPFDFEDLPYYIVQRGIVWKFENKRFYKEEEYNEWLSKLVDFLNSIPNEYRIKALIKGIDYGKKVYKYHLENECDSPDKCLLNQTWERRFALAENILEKVQPKPDSKNETEEGNEVRNKEFTTARQVLALHFIFEQLQIRSHEIDRSAKARIIEFLTGKNYKNIYDALENPLITKNKKFRFDDLQFIRKYFEDIGLSEIVKAINNQLDKPR